MNFIIDKNANIPLYFQLEQIIRSKIITGEFAAGQQIPTEKELCRSYGVSNITVRQAILNLVKQNILYRIQGKGTFVADAVRNIKTFHLIGSIKDISPDGLKTQEVKVLDITKIAAPRKVQDIFSIDESEQMVRVRRTRSVENIPVSYIVNYLPQQFGKKIKKSDLLKYPMLRILRDKCNIPISSGIQYIEAISSDFDTSSVLSISNFSPVLYIETTIFAGEKRPIEFVETFVRPDRYKYSVQLAVEKGAKNEIRIRRK